MNIEPKLSPLQNHKIKHDTHHHQNVDIPHEKTPYPNLNHIMKNCEFEKK